MLIEYPCVSIKKYFKTETIEPTIKETLVSDKRESLFDVSIHV